MCRATSPTSASSGCAATTHFSHHAHTYHALTRPPTPPQVFQTADGSFRPAADATACLELRTRGEETLYASACAPAADGKSTLDLARFVYDRFMGRYCLSSRPDVCLQEAILGAPMRLRQPGSGGCLAFDAMKMATLVERRCNASEPAQQWLYDTATLVFRAATDANRCLDFFVAHDTFGAWACREHADVNAQQQFIHDERTDRFCMITQPEKCLLEATSALLY